MAKYYSSTLQKGSKGDEVKEWQTFLNTQGYNLGVDGDFGDKTYAATIEWQKKNGLGADGIVGEKTWGKAGYTNLSTSTSAPTISAAPTTPTFNNTATTKPTVGNAPTGPTFNTTATATPVTDTTSWDDTTKGQTALNAYNSAKDSVNSYGDFTYDDYVMGEDAQAAKDALDAHNANKPGAYQSQWQTQLDSLMNSIMNRDKFSYDLNGDALYQQYKDKYIQQGKLAMADTMGQAAAMTGGYGSSYAQSVGQQAYQGQLDNLNDIVPELYQMALNKYNQEGQDLYDQYGLVMDRENTDYGRYRDTVSDWMTDRDYLTGRADTEYNRDYGQYIDDRNLDYTLHQDGYQKLLDSLGIAQTDYYTGGDVYRTEQGIKNDEAWKQYQASEDARQYANSLLQQGYENSFNAWQADSDNAWKQYQADEEARQYANSLLQQDYQNKFGEWEANTNNAWQQAQWDEAARQYANEEAWRQKEWDLTNEQWEWQKSQAAASGSGSSSGGAMYNSDGTVKEGYTTTNPAYFDENGNFKKATFSRYDSSGNAVWYIDGKEVIRQPGANPYTGAVNPDTKNGTFSNGYQPNNISGQKLTKSGITDTLNGVTQNVWKTPDGQLWIWDGTQNKYLKYTYTSTSAGSKGTTGGGGGGSKTTISLLN